MLQADAAPMMCTAHVRGREVRYAAMLEASFLAIILHEAIFEFRCSNKLHLKSKKVKQK